MAHRPFTRRQALQNQAFLEALRATGNPRLAARLLGVHRSTYTKRRAKSAAFAQGWDAALAAAHAAFHLAGGPRPPEPATHARSSRAKSRGVCDESVPAPLDYARDERISKGLRTKGGELHVGRTRGGRLQLRRAPAGWMTKAGEQTFFRALSATANVRLSAAATGFSHTAFYAKQRLRPTFAREMRLSLTMGYERVESAALAAALPESHEDDSWRHNDPPPIPPMTWDQAFQLLCLHNKTVRLSWDRPHRRKRRGEPWDAYTQRLSAMWTAEKGREAEDAALRRAAQYEATGDWRYEDEMPVLSVVEGPALDQVTGWSRASPDRIRVTYNPDLALFGGWRLKNWEKRKAGKE
ncbi:MAG TPA: hypothetical protein VEX35_03650 [Allosphingosinicella sp.]|nr:hypothetical protein [Allosphingosinicella sp.]